LNFLWIFKKYSNAKYHENLSGGSQAVPCRQADRQTDITKLILAFCDFANISGLDFIILWVFVLKLAV
jgi:hypothetical protein